ncbi:hypothetical protein ACFQRC_02460 [Enterovirga sp. GCM10030262]|uniref:hypothetical protein n=1 Tax=Enterovirga sp. GCM10030262 TaxID=3273391 RepID=UPI0036185463
MSAFLAMIGLSVSGQADLPSVAHLQPIVERFIVAVQSGVTPNPEDFTKPIAPEGAAKLKRLEGCAVNHAFKSPSTAYQVNVRWVCGLGQRPSEWYTLVQFSGQKISSVEIAEVEKAHD